MPLGKGRLLLLAQLSEKDWRQQVLAWARRAGWRCYFTWTSIRSPAGFPDLVLCRPPRLIFAELKTERGRVNQKQEEWISDLGQCEQVEAYIWRPHDEDLIQEVLR